MHHEYAVEPTAIGSSWDTFRYLIEKFGFQKGRLISRFPRTWERQVIEAAEAAGVPDVARARIVERLRQKKRTAIIRTRRAFDPDLDSWIANALASHAERPFRAIIAEGERAENDVVTPEDVEADHPLIRTPSSGNVPRTPEELAGACKLLLCAAREIDLVDPYFDLRNRGGNYRDPLDHMLRALQAAGKENVCIRIHYREHESRPSEAETLRSAGRWVNGIVPAGYELHLYCWEERPDGEDIHDRYLLCDCGGLMIGAGFAASSVHEHAAVTLLDDSHVQDLRARFADGASVYNQVGRAIRIQSNGRTDYC